MKQGYAVILKQRSFLTYTIANFINRFGDSIDMIAFTWLVYQISGSASWSAIILGVNLLPNVLIQPFAGALVEQLNKKHVLVFCDIIRGLLTCGIALLYVSELLNPWILLVITFLNSTSESFRMPAGTALLPSLLEKEHYEFGISFNQTSIRVCELIGTAMAGIIIATIGVSGAIIIDAISFFLCAILMSKIPLTTHVIHKTTLNISAYFTSLKEGIRYVRKLPILIVICFIGMFLNMALVPYNSFLAPFISGTLHQGAELLSLSGVLLSIGMLTGAFAYPYLHRYCSNKGILEGGALTFALFYLGAWLLSYTASPMVMYVTLCFVSFVCGCGVAFMNSMVSVTLVQKVEPAYLARFSSIFGAIATLAMPLTSFALSALCAQIRVETIFLYTSLFTIIIVVVMIFIKQLKEL